jgi:hypothetical protein
MLMASFILMKWVNPMKVYGSQIVKGRPERNHAWIQLVIVANHGKTSK